MQTLTLLAILLLLTPIAAQVILVALAAILFGVAWNMSEARCFARMARTAPDADRVVLLITVLLTVFTDLVIAVNVGVILAMLLFLRRMASAVEVLHLDERSIQSELLGTEFDRLPPDVPVFSIKGPFFLEAVQTLERALVRTHSDPRYVVIRLRRVPLMDITGIQSLEAAMASLTRQCVPTFLCGARRKVLRKLAETGLVSNKAAAPLYFSEFGLALRACKLAKPLAALVENA